MSEDRNRSHRQDHERIDVSHDEQLRRWAASLNTTPERLREAVEAVGDRAEAVRRFLGERDKSHA